MPQRFLLLCACAFISFTSNAQDKIYNRKKGLMEVNIMEVTRSRIYYRRLGELSGKDYVIDWDDVSKVEYADGKVDYRRPIPQFHLEDEKKQLVYNGKNIASAAIFSISEEGIGFGVAYERTLDKDAFVSLYLPAAIVYASPNNSNNYNNTALSQNRSIFKFMPGIKIYPTRNNGKVRYSVGPQLDLETGQKYTEIQKDLPNGDHYFVLEHHTVQKMGLMVSNAFNLYPNPNIYLAFELAAGATYYHRLSGASSGMVPLVQFNFRMGYRW